MRLLIFPGLGSPKSELYAGVYGLLDKLAEKRGFDRRELLLWPGQGKPGDVPATEITLDGAVEVAREALARADRDGPYTILARSFGTFAALQTVVSDTPSQLEKIILWGPSPYWYLWQLFQRDLDESVRAGLAKGVRVGPALLPSIAPIEVLLPVSQARIHVATGALDRYCRPAFCDYLKGLVLDCSNVTFAPAVPNAPHEVGPDAGAQVIRDYEHALFD